MSWNPETAGAAFSAVANSAEALTTTITSAAEVELPDIWITSEALRRAVEACRRAAHVQMLARSGTDAYLSRASVANAFKNLNAAAEALPATRSADLSCTPGAAITRSAHRLQYAATGLDEEMGLAINQSQRRPQMTELARLTEAFLPALSKVTGLTLSFHGIVAQRPETRPPARRACADLCERLTVAHDHLHRAQRHLRAGLTEMRTFATPT